MNTEKVVRIKLIVDGIKTTLKKSINQSINQSVKVTLILNNLDLHGREFVELTFGVL